MFIAACGDNQHPAISFELRELMRYGTDELADGPAGNNGVDVGGAILADVAGIARDSAGMLYVLDRDWKKIVVFAPNGGLRKVILGGVGDGPGEFRVPVHLTMTSTGAISVLDYALQRVTWFTDGDLAKTVRLQGRSMFRHAILGDTIVVTPGPGSTSATPIVRMYSADGELIDKGPALSVDDQPFGGPVGLTRGPNGLLLVSTRIPGVWMERRGGRWRRVGSALFPDLAPPAEEVTGPRMTRVTPAQADAGSIALYGDSLVLQGYMRYRRQFSWDDPPLRDEIDHFVVVFGLDGEQLGTIQLPANVDAACLYADRASGHVFLCSYDPFPQVIEYALEWS